MKDEVLQKALTTDSTVIPRYDIVLPDGTKVAENVQLVLKNTILTSGTPLNKQSLLKDATATLLGLSSSAVPDEALAAIRRSVGYCPRLRITGQYNTTVYVQNMQTNSQASYTITLANEITVDILTYGTYKIWGVLNGVRTPETIIDIDVTKMYTVNVSTFVHYCKVTVADEIGATISARSSDGYVVTGIVNSNKTCTLPLFKASTWSVFGTYSGYESNTSSIQVTGTMNGSTTEKSLTWTKVIVDVDSGSAVTLTKDGVSKSGVSVDQKCTIWLPSSGTWSATATLNGKTATGSIVVTQYATQTLTLRYT